MIMFLRSHIRSGPIDEQATLPPKDTELRHSGAGNGGSELLAQLRCDSRKNATL